MYTNHPQTTNNHTNTAYIFLYHKMEEDNSKLQRNKSAHAATTTRNETRRCCIYM